MAKGLVITYFLFSFQLIFLSAPWICHHLGAGWWVTKTQRFLSKSERKDLFITAREQNQTWKLEASLEKLLETLGFSSVYISDSLLQDISSLLREEEAQSPTENHWPSRGRFTQVNYRVPKATLLGCSRQLRRKGIEDAYLLFPGNSTSGEVSPTFPLDFAEFTWMQLEIKRCQKQKKSPKVSAVRNRYAMIY